VVDGRPAGSNDGRQAGCKPSAPGQSAALERPAQKRKSAQLQRAMVIAMAVMWVMQSSVHEVIDMIAVGHGFVSAARPMRMRAPGLRRAACGIGVADLDDMEVDMVPMHVVQAPIVQVIDVAVVSHGGVPAARAVLMRVVRSMRFGAGGRSFAHGSLLLSLADRNVCRRHLWWFRYPLVIGSSAGSVTLARPQLVRKDEGAGVHHPSGARGKIDARNRQRTSSRPSGSINREKLPQCAWSG
jgi:hypothetical protein